MHATEACTFRKRSICQGVGIRWIHRADESIRTANLALCRTQGDRRKNYRPVPALHPDPRLCCRRTCLRWMSYLLNFRINDIYPQKIKQKSIDVTSKPCII